MLTLTSYCQSVNRWHHCKHHSQQLQSSPSTSDDSDEDLEGEEVDMDAIVMKTTIQKVVAFIFIADTSSYTPHFALFETLSERERERESSWSEISCLRTTGDSPFSFFPYSNI